MDFYGILTRTAGILLFNPTRQHRNLARPISLDLLDLNDGVKINGGKFGDLLAEVNYKDTPRQTRNAW